MAIYNLEDSKVCLLVSVSCDYIFNETLRLRFAICIMCYLGVQQCFGVVYHELTTLRRVYFARTALAARTQ